MEVENKDLEYRYHQELMDSLDEELEMELDDERLGSKVDDTKTLNRKFYFRELLSFRES